MDSSYQNSQGHGMQQSQGNGSNQIEYVPKNGFEAQMIHMLKEIQLEQRIAKFQARRDTEERRNRADYEAQLMVSFMDMVYDKLCDLQNQTNAITVSQEEREKRTAFEEDVTQKLDRLASTMGQSKIDDLSGQMNQTLKVHDEKNMKMFEAHFVKTVQNFEEIIREQVGDLPYEFEALNCHMQRVEDRMEKEMGQLFTGMFKTQGWFDDSSDGESVYHQFYQDELPGYIDDSNEEKAEHQGFEIRDEPPSQVPSTEENKSEQFSCEDVIASRVDYLSNGAAHDRTMDMDGMREGDYMACAPIQERDPFLGVEFPLPQEDDSLPPTIMPCFSCEIACTPQVRACFGVLASSASRENSHDESSWEDKESSVEVELEKRQRNKQGRCVTQVWIPRGTLEVMKVFNMTELNLGDMTCVPHKAKKRKRRRKASNPQSGIG